MNGQVLIDQLVRQTMVLIAQLATTGGARAPLARVADRVFLELARELEAQGLSRKVTADMFGLALRSYRRRIQRVSESVSVEGRSLWSAIVDFIPADRLITRGEVLTRFALDDPALVRGILGDLRESGLILQLGRGVSTAYRAATREELSTLDASTDGLAQLLWLLVYREGPLSTSELLEHVGGEAERVDCALEALTEAGHVALDDGRYSSVEVVVSRDEPSGWEAAMLDHFQALVQTLCARLRGQGDAAQNGGSTYSFDVHPGHPLAPEAYAFLERSREQLSALRSRIEEYNRNHPEEVTTDLLTVYVGQHVRTEQTDEDD